MIGRADLCFARPPRPAEPGSAPEAADPRRGPVTEPASARTPPQHADGAFSGCTVLSVEVAGDAGSDPALRQELADPYSLCPAGGAQRVQPDAAATRRLPHVSARIAPYLCTLSQSIARAANVCDFRTAQSNIRPAAVGRSEPLDWLIQTAETGHRIRARRSENTSFVEERPDVVRTHATRLDGADERPPCAEPGTCLNCPVNPPWCPRRARRRPCRRPSTAAARCASSGTPRVTRRASLRRCAGSRRRSLRRAFRA